MPILEAFFDPFTFNNFCRYLLIDFHVYHCSAHLVVFYKDMRNWTINIIFNCTWHETKFKFSVTLWILKESNYIFKYGDGSSIIPFSVCFSCSAVNWFSASLIICEIRLLLYDNTMYDNTLYTHAHTHARYMEYNDVIFHT